MDGLAWSDVVELFGHAIAAALLAGLVAPLVGCFLLVRRTGFYGIALPQFAAAGVAFGFALAAWAPGLVALLALDETALASGTHGALNYHLAWAGAFTFGGLILLGFFSRARETETGRIAAAFAIAAAATILFAHASATGDVYVHDLLRGEILAVGEHDLHTLEGVLGAVVALFLLFRNDLVLVSYDRESARVLGKPTLAFELLLQLLTGATIAVSVMTVGPVVLFGLLVVPPLAARGLARSMRAFFLWASALGLLSAALGVVVSFRFDWPLGPAVVATASLALPVGWLAGRRRG